jgi:hypothetical protein
MDNQKNKFETPHFVALTLVKKAKADSMQHRAYYHQPEIKDKLVFYGEVLNQEALHIVISVRSDKEFEQIIINDPGINARLYELKAVTSFVSTI